MNKAFKAEVFENQELLNEFILKNKDIEIIKVERNGDKRALFYEMKEKVWKNDYEYEGLAAKDYEGWNQTMWENGFPFMKGLKKRIPFTGIPQDVDY